MEENTNFWGVKPQHFYCSSGNRYEKHYKEEINEKTGKIKVVEDGKIDRVEQIKAAFEETKIENIITKYTQTGDTSLLMKNRQIISGDFTKIPQTPIEVMNMRLNAERKFNALDSKVKEAFDNDVNVFAKSVVDGTFKEKMQKFMPKKVEKPTQQTTQQNTEVSNNE